MLVSSYLWEQVTPILQALHWWSNNIWEQLTVYCRPTKFFKALCQVTYSSISTTQVSPAVMNVLGRSSCFFPTLGWYSQVITDSHLRLELLLPWPHSGRCWRTSFSRAFESWQFLDGYYILYGFWLFFVFIYWLLGLLSHLQAIESLLDCNGVKV